MQKVRKKVLPVLFLESYEKNMCGKSENIKFRFVHRVFMIMLTRSLERILNSMRYTGKRLDCLLVPDYSTIIVKLFMIILRIIYREVYFYEKLLVASKKF